MFSSAPQTTPLRSRAWGIGLGTLVMVGVPIILISAKTVQVTLPLLLVAASAGALARGQPGRIRLTLNPAVLGLFAFLAYAALSALWAPEPRAAILIVLMGALIAAGSLVLAELLRSEPFEDALHIIEGLWIGLAAGLIYAIAEIASGQAIKMWFYNALALGPDALSPPRYFTWENGRLIAIHRDDITRNVVPIPLLIWPALMGASLLRDSRWRRGICIGLAALTTAAVLMGTGATSKFAWLLGALAFAAARYRPRATQLTLSLAWITACLAVIPAVLLARELNLQDAGLLHLSAKLRIMMWDEIARMTAGAPILGIGADMTYVLQPPMPIVPAAAPPEYAGTPIVHPHNVYLQTWYELGLVGALLLTAFGVLLLRQIGSLSPAQRPYAFALFTAAAIQIAFSYNLWQIWFMCLFGFAAAMFALGTNVIENHNVRISQFGR